MDKLYKNVATDKIVSFSRYIVIAEYETQEEAENNLNADVNKWMEENKNKPWYKLAYPFAWATIKERERI